jgi:transposase
LKVTRSGSRTYLQIVHAYRDPETGRPKQRHIANLGRADQLDCKYLISTTDPTLSAEDVALGYKQLMDVERSFRTLKTMLELRPPYHRLSERIPAHVLLCWLALLLVRVAQSETGMTWDRIRSALEEISLVKLSSKDGRVEMVTELAEEQRNMLKSLSVKTPKRVQKLAETA